MEKMKNEKKVMDVVATSTEIEKETGLCENTRGRRRLDQYSRGKMMEAKEGITSQRAVKEIIKP